jgi:hypothetical protein|tara:strand:+ start:13 stop:1008 length:996 start_codon:yes stop_codon:yes gene_type:complete
MRITIVPSNNGLGHIKRQIFLANFLVKYFKIDLVVPKNISKYFFIKKKIKIINYNLSLRINKTQYNYSWFKFLNTKIFDKTDLFISDNLPEILRVNKKCILFANFFWHQILKMNRKKKSEIHNIIKKKNVPVFCNYFFVNKKIISNYNVKKLGFFGKFEGRKKKKIKNILISLGTATLENSIKKQIYFEVINFLKLKKNTNFNFYIDPILDLKKIKKSGFNVCKANYSKNMYKKIDLAIIKPGLGTVHDCLQNAIPIITYTKFFNDEFLYNAKILEMKKLAINITNFKILSNFLERNKYDEKFLKNYFSKCKNLIWNGEKKFLELIKKNNY